MDRKSGTTTSGRNRSPASLPQLCRKGRGLARMGRTTTLEMGRLCLVGGQTQNECGHGCIVVGSSAKGVSHAISIPIQQTLTGVKFLLRL